MKKRSLGIMILGYLFTFGIYPIYWFCSFQNQLKKETGEGFGGAGHFFAALFSLGIYTLVWTYKVGGRIEKLGGKNEGTTYLLLSIFGLGIVAYMLMQNEVNRLPEKETVVPAK